MQLLMLLISVLDLFNKYWMDVRDLSAKLPLAQIVIGVGIRVELFHTFHVKYR